MALDYMQDKMDGLNINIQQIQPLSYTYERSSQHESTTHFVIHRFINCILQNI